MSNDIVWEDPPSRASKWVQTLGPLLERVGDWARVAEKGSANLAASTARAIKVGKFAMPPGRWDAVARTVDGHHYVYARYLGPEE